MKMIKLLTSAYAGGVLRHPDEGVISVSEEDAQRLFDNQAAVDVSSDFTAKQMKDMPTENITATPDVSALGLAPVQHQSEVAPQAVDLPVPDAGAEPATSKE